MGPLDELLGMIPGVNSKALKGLNVGDKEIKRIEAMIQSMTNHERENPEIIDASRRKRIAKGSGTNVSELNKLLKQFKDTRKMMKQFGNMGKGMKKRGKFNFPLFK